MCNMTFDLKINLGNSDLFKVMILINTWAFIRIFMVYAATRHLLSYTKS